jgi:pilus assembly protein Flp/PilA
MLKQMSKLHRSEAGVTAIEYALIAALVAIAVIAGSSFAGTRANATFNGVGTRMSQTQ